METIDNWTDDQSCQTVRTDMTNFQGVRSMACMSRGVRSLVGVCVTYTMFTVFTLGGNRF